MSTEGENFDYEEFIKENNFLKPLIFNQIYENFNNYISNTDGEKYCNRVKDQFSISSSYKEHISHFCNILYKIIFNLKGFQNDLYDKELEDYKMYCSLLKYWLYEKKETLPILHNTDHIYQSAKNKLEIMLQDNKTFPCTFYELDWKDMIKLKKIYAFVLIYFSNLGKFKNEYIDCKYLNHLGKGLVEFYSSMNTCSKKWTQDNFCNELTEIQKNYKLDNFHLIHFTEDTVYQFEADETVGCPLEIKSMNKPFHLLYKEGKNRWLLTDEPISSLNNSIISASSAIGATVGISSILVYLFKFTNIGSLFGRGKEDNNAMFLNIDEETPDFTYSISEPEHNNLGNSTYNISYYSVGNS
ncbi:PIR protein [Plasmodium ovale]|uniref:PIR Superfamily Protein n=2 Tax=Plasmodium ovale TaxID=36330 RepID=A0A1A8WGZ6_PLAOA|nr:PIR Superfamily Protein [Plasmodium ovale curtisi]SBT84240.1 PIR protein [Plasmodium ovale]